MIPLNERVVVRAKNKKSVYEIERYWKDDDEILVSTLWRNGEFAITCRSLKEARFLEKMFNTKKNTEVCLTIFEECEILMTYDGISTEFLGDCDDLAESMEDSVDDDMSYWQWLEDNGWEHIDTEYFIYGGVEYVQAD